jgi:capsid protein
LSLPFSKYEKYCNVKWTAKGFKSVNLVETARSYVMLYNLGILSLQQISSEIGLDWEETISMVARENKKIEQLGIKLNNNIDVYQLEQNSQVDNNLSDK